MLALERVNAYYGSIHAIRDVTMEVRAGEIVALVGANGAGKSTTLMTVSGVLSPRSGSVRFEGEEIAGLPAHEVVRRGIVQSPEGRRVFANLTVMENLEMGAYSRRDRAGIRQDLEMCLSLFPVIAERRRVRAGALSGGEQQQLAIARSLMARARLLLLDEPSLGLAPILVDLIFEKIQEINREGITVLLVEQNARQALAIANRAYVLESGKVIATGTGRELAQDERIVEYYLGG
ncbi:MAG: ABC transporter ATP-binding protein [Planctomycetota bacterium]